MILMMKDKIIDLMFVCMYVTCTGVGRWAGAGLLGHVAER